MVTKILYCIWVGILFKIWNTLELNANRTIKWWYLNA